MIWPYKYNNSSFGLVFNSFKKKINFLFLVLVIFVFIFSFFSFFVKADDIVITLDSIKEYYSHGNTVFINGSLTQDGNGLSSKTIGILVSDNGGSKTFVAQAFTNDSGFYSSNFVLNDNLAYGVYTVFVSYEDIRINDSFILCEFIPPILSDEAPSNNSDIYHINPTLSIKINDSDDGFLDCYWYSNSSGSWELFAYNSSVNVSSGAISLFQNNNNLSSYDTRYYWSINCTDGNVWTNETYNFIIIDLINPLPPSDFSAKAVSSDQINLSWIKGINADYAYIEYNTFFSSWIKGNGIFLTNTTDNFYYHQNLENGITYYYQAWSYNLSDNRWSANFSSSNDTTNNNPPSFNNPFPANKSIIKNLSVNFSINISDSDGDSFNYSIKCSNGQSKICFNETSGIKEIKLNNLNYSTEYIIWVNATDSISFTNESFLFSTREKYIPLIPIIFSAISYNRTQINLTWENYGSNNTYIEWNNVSSWSFGFGNIIVNSSIDNSFLHNNLSFNTSYYYQAWSYNLTDNCYSASSFFVNNSTKVNTAPILDAPNPSNESTNQELSFTWSIYLSDIDSDLLNYTIECSNGQFIYENLSYAGFKNISLSDLEYSTFYNVWVNVTDGFENINRLFHFTTKSEPSSPGPGPSPGGISPQPPSDDSSENQLPVAVIAGPIESIVNSSIFFDASDSYDLDGEIINYTWDFGDGIISYGVSITHIYSTTGLFNLTLIVKDNNNTIDSSSIVIYITKKDSKDFLFDVELELTKEIVYVGEKNNALINLINVGEPGLVNCTLNYTLYRMEDIIWSYQENLSVYGGKAFTKIIDSNNLTGGDYRFEVIHYYGNNQSASANDSFIVKNQIKKDHKLKDNTFCYISILILIIILFLILLYIYKRYFYDDDKKMKKLDEEKKKIEKKIKETEKRINEIENK